VVAFRTTWVHRTNTYWAWRDSGTLFDLNTIYSVSCLCEITCGSDLERYIVVRLGFLLSLETQILLFCLCKAVKMSSLCLCEVVDEVWFECWTLSPVRRTEVFTHKSLRKKRDLSDVAMVGRLEPSDSKKLDVVVG